MTRLWRYCVDNDVPLEVNGLGYITNRWYPREDFFRLAVSMGGRFVFGCDAHNPGQVLQPEEMDGFLDYFESLSVTFDQPSI